MYMIADGSILTKLVCENTDCLSFIISFLDILTVLFLAFCASFRVTKAVRVVGWVWAAAVIAATVAVVAIHTCLFTLVSALFTALVLMALFGVTFESIGNKKEGEKAAEPTNRPFACPFATMQCAMAQQNMAQNAAVEAKSQAPAKEMKNAEYMPETAEKPAEKPAEKEEVKDELAADNTEGLSLRESLAMAVEVESVPAVINKKYIVDFLQKTFGAYVECNTRGNYTKTGLPLADTHYVLGHETRKCFVYVYETDAAVVMLLCLTPQYAKSVRDGGHRINKSAFPKSKDAWYSVVVDGSYTEADVQKILVDACNMAR